MTHDKGPSLTAHNTNPNRDARLLREEEGEGGRGRRGEEEET